MKFNVKHTNMVKCMAILFMLIHHLFYCSMEFCNLYGISSAPFSMEHLLIFSKMAKICVGIYVFLTAYGIARSFRFKYGDLTSITLPELEKICISRYKKLMLNFLSVYVVVFCTTPFFNPDGWNIYFENGWKFGIIYIVLDMLGLAYHFSTPTLNPTWWYMSTAILLIFLVPVLIKLYKNYGGIAVVISVSMLCFGTNPDGVIEYVACIMMGIFCADADILEKIYEKSICKNKYMNSLLKLVLWSVLFYFLIWIRKNSNWIHWTDAVIPIVCCEICIELSSLFPITEKLLGFIGEHSMNIFLLHTMFYMYYFTEFIYRWKNWLAIVSVLLLVSLLTSIVLEKLKQIIQYQKIKFY